MKKLAFLLFAGYLVACSPKTTPTASSDVAENTSNNTTNATQHKTHAAKASISNDLTDKFSGEYTAHDGKKYMYSLEKETDFPDRYDLVIQVFVKGNDSGTYTTVYKSYLNYLQNPDDLKVQLHYAIKPNAYSWKHFPSSFTEATFQLKDRHIQYNQIGEGWKTVKAHGKIDHKKFEDDKLSIKKAFDIMVKYYIENYPQTFHK